ncbi:hypothetical protein SAMN02745225_00735 [Ferrithrix thermotolerans DSM 19514]|uniref:Amine oxidase domain-containing protein n=1 Tax=Ferrithrix thermotolerans DSM 19514 TaxID=1121881 RepID=A0A1M4TVH2_9ACTN|nr:FAD-dependent oxidoreductase [Ferrithrix thermotolerans]SHE48472.1 hypothetical protein SAMN02745225_00735 [Ferrithrix thermotolerans DSM 19514]
MHGVKKLDAVVVGGGMSGVSAARRLKEAGLLVRVVDKGVSLGGRMATRRVAGGLADHGAQFITVRSDEFQSLVDRLYSVGQIKIWHFGWERERDGFPRYVGTKGMNSLLRSVGDGLDFTTGFRASSVKVMKDGSYKVFSDDGRSFSADTVLVTTPLPQALQIVSDLDTASLDELSVAYHSTVAVIAPNFTGKLPNGLGAVKFTDFDKVAIVVDNAQKGISEVPVLTVHFGHEMSARLFDLEDYEVLEACDAALATYEISIDTEVAQVKRWRYATPQRLLPSRFLELNVDKARYPVFFSGDAFLESRVEGAYLSGYWASAKMIDVLRGR